MIQHILLKCNTVPKFLSRFSESSSFFFFSVSLTPSMAANKFATLLHRNTNTVVVTLVYAVLEWLLILLLLLNSLFSYVITKFAKWVGLKPPCLLCSRLDHVLEPESKLLQSEDVVCETHAAEISKMGFCSVHGKMAETQSMCEDCLVSIRGMAFVSWFSEKSERCSCCDKSLRTTYTSKETLILEASDDDDDDEEDEEGDRECDHQILFDVESFILREVAEDRSNSSVSKDAEKDEKEDDLLIITETETDPISESHNLLLHSFSESVWEDRSFGCISLHFETNVDDNDQRLIPVELIDSFTSSANFEACKSEEGLGKKDQKIQTLASESSIEAELSITSLKNHMVLEEDEELKTDADNVESATEKQDDDDEEQDQSSSSDDDAEDQNAFDEFIAQNNICQSQSLFCGDNDIGTSPEEADDNAQENLPQSEEPSCPCECIEDDDQSLTSDDDAEVADAFDKFIAQNNLGLDETGENDNEDADPSLFEENHEETSHNNHSSKSSEEDEVEEDKLPETPSSVNGLHYLHEKLLLYEKTESGGAAEDSVDGSEIENGDSLSTIEQLKMALKAERKALSALYQELEEERSASAIAANQTMAMITRLQEEKAAMQMEALQYQRMMEEQSEYDQEALQLLNDLMVKREKEKKELEKELEEYKHKVMDFEAKEKLRVLRRMKNGSDRSRESSSAAPSEQSIDLNCEPREEDEEEEENNINTTTSIDTVSSLEEMTMDCVKHMNALDSSLAEFEEEKLSILDQLKSLEKKLITLGDKEQLLDDLNQNCFFSSPEEEEDDTNVCSDDKQKCHSPRMPMASLAKRLLPFLDAVNDDDETEESYSCRGLIDNNTALKEVSIEEEVDQVYEKLHALETDTEFLRNCMGSSEEGDQKGMDLLQDILQNLRDLKAVELRLNQLGDDDLLR